MEGENKRTDSSREYKEKGRTSREYKEKGRTSREYKVKEQEDTAAAGYMKKKGGTAAENIESIY